MVTADGAVRIANACTNPELFWGLKGGGGGSLGVVTRLTLRVHELPESFGAVNITIKATSAPAFRRLIGMIVDFYARSLLNPHWGEQIRLRPDNVLKISMVFQGLGRSEAQAVWQPFLDSVDAAPAGFRGRVLAAEDRRDLGAHLLGAHAVQESCSASSAPTTGPTRRRAMCSGRATRARRASSCMATSRHGCRRRCCARSGGSALADALFAASRHWTVSLHVNKGLAGAPDEAVAAARDTAMNPAVLDAFALVICGARRPPAFPGVAGHEPDAVAGAPRAQAIGRAMDELRKLVPEPGSYVSESNYFEPDWQHSFWGPNYPRLLAAKEKYDPEGLFFVHHGVGSEGWSADGFTRLA